MPVSGAPFSASNAVDDDLGLIWTTYDLLGMIPARISAKSITISPCQGKKHNHIGGGRGSCTDPSDKCYHVAAQALVPDSRLFPPYPSHQFIELVDAVAGGNIYLGLKQKLWTLKLPIVNQ